MLDLNGARRELFLQFGNLCVAFTYNLIASEHHRLQGVNVVGKSCRAVVHEGSLRAFRQYPNIA